MTERVYIFRCDGPGVTGSLAQRLYADVQARDAATARKHLPLLCALAGINVDGWRIKALKRTVADPEQRQIAFWRNAVTGKYTAVGEYGAWVLAGLSGQITIGTAVSLPNGLPDLRPR